MTLSFPQDSRLEPLMGGKPSLPPLLRWSHQEKEEGGAINLPFEQCVAACTCPGPEGLTSFPYLLPDNQICSPAQTPGGSWPCYFPPALMPRAWCWALAGMLRREECFQNTYISWHRSACPPALGLVSLWIIAFIPRKNPSWTYTQSINNHYLWVVRKHMISIFSSPLFPKCAAGTHTTSVLREGPKFGVLLQVPAIYPYHSLSSTSASSPFSFPGRGWWKGALPPWSRPNSKEQILRDVF